MVLCEAVNHEEVLDFFIFHKTARMEERSTGVNRIVALIWHHDQPIFMYLSFQDRANLLAFLFVSTFNFFVPWLAWTKSKRSMNVVTNYARLSLVTGKVETVLSIKWWIWHLRIDSRLNICYKCMEKVMHEIISRGTIETLQKIRRHRMVDTLMLKGTLESPCITNLKASRTNKLCDKPCVTNIYIKKIVDICQVN